MELTGGDGLLVSIDSQRSVTLGKGLLDTKLGQVAVLADLAPFDLFSVRGATQSRIIDYEVKLTVAGEKRAALAVTICVYFMGQDGNEVPVIGKILLASNPASTGFTLHRVRSTKGQFEVPDAELGKLADRLELLAEYYAWISFLGWVRETDPEGFRTVKKYVVARRSEIPTVKTATTASGNRSGHRYELN